MEMHFQQQREGAKRPTRSREHPFLWDAYLPENVPSWAAPGETVMLSSGVNVHPAPGTAIRIFPNMDLPYFDEENVSVPNNGFVYVGENPTIEVEFTNNGTEPVFFSSSEPFAHLQPFGVPDAEIVYEGFSSDPTSGEGTPEDEEVTTLKYQGFTVVDKPGGIELYIDNNCSFDFYELLEKGMLQYGKIPILGEIAEIFQGMSKGVLEDAEAFLLASEFFVLMKEAAEVVEELGGTPDMVTSLIKEGVQQSEIIINFLSGHSFTIEDFFGG